MNYNQRINLALDDCLAIPESKRGYIRRKIGKRVTYEPWPQEFKAALARLAHVLTSVLLVHKHCYAYKPGCDFVRDMIPRFVGKKVIAHFDINKFFDNIKKHHIVSIVRGSPGVQVDAGLVASVCTNRGFLPQGSPVAPCLSNSVLYNVDRTLDALGENCGTSSYVYARYSDDIYIGSNNRIPEAVEKLVADVLGEQGFKLNKEDTRYMTYASGMQRILGVNVRGQSLNQPGKMYLTREKRHQLVKEGQASGLTSSFSGKLNFVKRVNPEEYDRLYRVAIQATRRIINRQTL